MVLADWLETHKETLVSSALQKLSDRELLRQYAESPVRWFFNNLIQTITQKNPEHLETLLRSWVMMCRIPINGDTIGMLPVLSVFKHTIWEVFRADPPSESALEAAIELDTVISRAVDFVSKIEAAAWLDTMSHKLLAQTNALDISAQQEESVKGSFVSVAAHELKTPLTVIEGYTNMLKMDLSDGSHPRAALMVQGLESGIIRLRELIEDMIDVSLIEMGLLSLDQQPTWLRRVWNIVDFEAREAIQQRNLSLTIKHDTLPDKPTIGDPERLLRAFQKVLANAIKYTPDGGQITVQGQSLNGFIDLTIADTGIGIAPENLERIFEKFSAIGDITRHSSGKVKFKGGGAGLGLVIAKGIIEAHGGTIWADSPGFDEETCPGARFHILLPMRDIASGEGMSPWIASAMEMIGDKLADTDHRVHQTGLTKEKHMAGELSTVNQSDIKQNTQKPTLEDKTDKSSRA